MAGTVLIIGEDELKSREVARIIGNRLGLQANWLPPESDALRRFGQQDSGTPDVLIMENSSSSLSQLPAEIVVSIFPSTPIIVLEPIDRPAQKPDINVFQVLSKPVSLLMLDHAIRSSVQMKRLRDYAAWLEQRLAGRADFRDIVGESPTLKEALAQARKASQNSQTLCIAGEAGTGKEMLARAIHSAGIRASRPFVAVDCAMLDASGAMAFFLGKGRIGGGEGYSLGKLQEADGGSLLIKNMALLPEPVRLALYHAMQTGEVRYPGAAKAEATVNVRFMLSQRGPSGPNPMPGDMRLVMPQLSLPPLRDRVGDIAPIGEQILAIAAAGERKYIRGFEESARQWLERQAWPGNVAQLAHVIRRAVILCEGEAITVGDLESSGLPRASGASYHAAAQGAALRPLRLVEEEAIRFAIEQCGGSMTKAARSLGIGRSTLYRKIGEMKRGGKEDYISRANQTTRPMMSVSSTPRS